MRAQRLVGEHRYDLSERHSTCLPCKTLRGLALAAVVFAALGGQVALGLATATHASIGGVQVVDSGSIQPDGGTLGGPGNP